MSEALAPRALKISPPLTADSLNDIGGAVVRRSFNGKRANTVLSADEVRGIGKPNIRALISGGYLSLFPAPRGGKRFMRKNDEGMYDVIEGHQINDAPMSRDEAKALMRAGKH